MTVTDYKVISSINHEAPASIRDIELDVRKAIIEGWKPIGGICAAGTDHFCYYQAMVKEQPEDRNYPGPR